MATSFKVRGIEVSKHKSGEFAALFLYFLGKNNMGHLVYAFLTCEIYLVEGHRANLLIGNNIMSLEGFFMDVKRRNVLIRGCGVTVPINTKQKEQFLIRKLLPSPNSHDFLSPRGHGLACFSTIT